MVFYNLLEYLPQIWTVMSAVVVVATETGQIALRDEFIKGQQDWSCQV